MNELLKCWGIIVERSSPHGDFADIGILEFIDSDFSNPLFCYENTWGNFRDKYIMG